MTRPTNIVTAMLAMLTFFEGRCADATTLQKLIALAGDRSRWKEARALFSEIRQKTLAAEKCRRDLEVTQYLFEEICAKTLYNITHGPAPFDPDSPFWVLPLAVDLGSHLGIDDLGEISALLRPRRIHPSRE